MQLGDTHIWVPGTADILGVLGCLWCVDCEVGVGGEWERKKGLRVKRDVTTGCQWSSFGKPQWWFGGIDRRSEGGPTILVCAEND